MDTKTVLTGNLKFLSLGDLLQLLGSNGRTGVLKLSSPCTSNCGRIYLKSGEVVNAEYGVYIGVDAVHSLFGWKEGVFEFSSKEINCEVLIKKSRMQLILDALSLIDEGQIEILGSSEKEDLEDAPVFKGQSVSEGLITGPFIEYMYVVDEEKYNRNDTIIKEGKHGNWMWVVLEGELEIIKDDVSVTKVGTGAFIGSISSILDQEYKRSATVKAVTDVQLGVIDSRAIIEDLNQLSQDFKQWFLSIDKRFQRITERVVELKKGAGRLEGLPEGLNPMIKQGDIVKKVFQILFGEAYIVKKTENGKFLLCKLEEGDYIGHIPIMNMNLEPDGSSVYVSENLKLKIVNSEHLLEEYQTMSQTLKNIIEYKAMCISATARLAVNEKY